MPTLRETHLAWAARSWDAEVENARRLATRVNVVLTVALAAAAAGTKILGDALTGHSAERLSLALLGGAVAGVVCIFIAFVRVLTKAERRGRMSSASALLLPPEDIGGAAGDAPDGDTALQRACLATTAAAYELHARNAEEKKRLAVAQQWLVVGAALTLLCGALYTWMRHRF